MGDRLVSGLDLTLEPERRLRRIEVINGAGGRRRWSAEDKARIVEETLVPGGAARLLLGACAPALLRARQCRPGADRRGGAGAPGGALPDRGRAARPHGRGAPGRAPGAQPALAGGVRALAAGAARADQPEERARRGDPLRPRPLGRPEPVPRGRPGRDRQQRGGARDPPARDEASIVHPFFKCLGTLEVGFPDRCDTGNPFPRSQRRSDRPASRRPGSGRERQARPARPRGRDP